MKKLTLIAALFAAALPGATRAWEPGTHTTRESAYRLSASSSHTCVALYDGSVRCWGSGTFGALGNGSTASSSTPVAVTETLTLAPLSNVIAVTSGIGFSCALTSSGTVFCWGNNFSGQLGDGTTVSRSRATLVGGLSNVVRISAGDNHACALQSTGDVRCWGANSNGQIGDGTTGNRPAPTLVPGLAATEITSGGSHSCALQIDGTAKCWGRNLFGQVGVANPADQLSPVPVTNLTDAFVLRAGSNFTCAISTGGVTKCWGQNATGQLGVGDNSNRTQATPVLNLQNAVWIEPGTQHTCAQTAGGQVQCWGNNADGRLGNNSTGSSNVPVSVSSLTMVVAATAGGTHSCAMRADGTVWCWGDGASGRLGNTFAQSLIPVAVANVAGGVSAKAVATGGQHTCALRSNGSVSCWGLNTVSGIPPNGGTFNGVLGFPSAEPVVPSPTVVPGLSFVTGLSASLQGTCALIADGTVKCWGMNFAGRLGLGNTNNQPVPVTVPGLTGIVSVEISNANACALTVSGVVLCWGSALVNGTGGPATMSPTFATAGAVRIASGLSVACLTRANGSAACWGDGSGGQMGNGLGVSQNPLPVPVPSEIFTTISATSAVCGIASNGAIRCWGRNQFGGVGNGTSGNNVLSPVFVMNNGVKVNAGLNNTCAIDAGGAGRCWGRIATGMFINPNPTQLLNLSGAIHIATGDGPHSCATRATGALLCWGENIFGSLGLGSTAPGRAFSPTEVPSFTLNIVPTVQLQSSNPRRLTVNIVANCEAGERLQVRVDVTQGSVSGHGNETADCAGLLATFPVEVHAQGNSPFAAGAATVEADAVIRNRGDRDRQQWTRAVQIVQ